MGCYPTSLGIIADHIGKLGDAVGLNPFKSEGLGVLRC